MSIHFSEIFRIKGGDITKQEQTKIYDNICEAAKTKEISINSIEKKAGLSSGSLCKWNNVSPTVRSLKKVANILGCSLDKLTD